MTLEEALVITGMKLVGDTFFAKEEYESHNSFPIAPRIISIRKDKAKAEHELSQTDESKRVLAAWEHVVTKSNELSYAEMDKQASMDRWQ